MSRTDSLFSLRVAELAECLLEVALPHALEMRHCHNLALSTQLPVFQLQEMGQWKSLWTIGLLLRFPIDKIKIDRLFIKDIETNANSLAIVRAVVSLGQSLGITVAAEGVETKEQFDLFRKEGCREMQGNFISPPLQGHAADAFLKMRGTAKLHVV